MNRLPDELITNYLAMDRRAQRRLEDLARRYASKWPDKTTPAIEHHPQLRLAYSSGK